MGIQKTVRQELEIPVKNNKFSKSNTLIMKSAKPHAYIKVKLTLNA